MINRISRIFIVFSAMALAGCGETLDIQLEPEVRAYLAGGSEQAMHLTAQDDEYEILNKWLRENRSDWYPTSGRYPGGVYIKSGSRGIQITDALVILYSTEHSEPRALYVQKIIKDELMEIKSLGR